MGILDNLQAELDSRSGDTATPPPDTPVSRLQAALVDRQTPAKPSSAPTLLDNPMKKQPGMSSGPPADFQSADDKEQAASDERTSHFQDLIDKNKLGGKYSDEPGDMGFTTQFQIARSDNDKDIRAKFQASHPDGEVTFQPGPDGSKTLLYKTDPDDSWHQARLGLGNVAATATDPRVLAGAGAAIATGGASVPVQIGAQAAAGGIGSLANYGIERAQGYDADKTAGDVTQETLTDAGVGAGGAAIGAAGPVSGAVKSGVAGLADRYYGTLANTARKSFGTGFGDGAFAGAADRLGVPEPTLGQISGNSNARERFKQSLNTDTAREAVEGQNIAVKNKLEDLAASGVSLSKEQLTALQSGQLDEATSALETQKALPQGATSSDAGQATQVATQKYSDTSKKAIDEKIAEVENNAKLDDVNFNIGKLKSIWANAKDGVVGVGKNVDEQGVADAVPISQPSPALQAIGGKIEDLSKTMENADLTRKLPGDVNRRVAPTTTTFSAVRQLSDIRDQLSVLQNSKNPGDAALAGRMYDEVVSTLNKPVGASSETISGLKELTDAQAQRDGNLAMLRGQLTASNADKLGTGIVAPGNGKQLALLQKTDPDSYATIVDGFRGQLMNDPKNIPRTLAKFGNDQPTLDAVMPRDEQQAWRTYAAAKMKFDKVSASTADTPAAGPVRLLMGDTKLAPNDLNTVVQRSATDAGVTNTWEAPAAQQARAELYSNVLKQSTEISGKAGGKEVLNVSKAQNMLDDISKDERYNAILGPADRQKLTDFKTYLSMIKESQGGSSLAQQGVVRTLFKPFEFIRSPKAWGTSLLTSFNNDTVGKVFSQPASANLFLKAASAGPSARSVSMLTGALALAGRSASQRLSTPDNDDQ